MGLAGVLLPPGGTALDAATGGGHTALFLARQGWKVTAGDISRRMLENAQKLCADAGFVIETRMFPAEEMPIGEGAFDLITTRVALNISAAQSHSCGSQRASSSPAAACW